MFDYIMQHFLPGNPHQSERKPGRHHASTTPPPQKRDTSNLYLGDMFLWILVLLNSVACRFCQQLAPNPCQNCRHVGSRNGRCTRSAPQQLQSQTKILDFWFKSCLKQPDFCKWAYSGGETDKIGAVVRSCRYEFLKFIEFGL